MINFPTYILSIFWVPLLITQIILVLFMGKISEAGIIWLMYLGWFIWVLSIIFGWLPIYILRKKGNVTKGKSYVHTTKLVKTGLYSVVRHPQYTAGMLFSLALILISQDLWVIIIGFKIILLLYIDIYLTDRWELKKFGQEYKEYMDEVPRVNFILGIIRLFKKEGEENEN